MSIYELERYDFTDDFNPIVTVIASGSKREIKEQYKSLIAKDEKEIYYTMRCISGDPAERTFRIIFFLLTLTNLILITAILLLKQ